MDYGPLLERAPLLYLTTIGRRSGRPRTVELWFAYQDGRIYLLGHDESHWIGNLGAHPAVTFEVNGHTYEGTARLTDQLRNRILGLFREKYGAAEVAYWYGEEAAGRRTVEVTITSSRPLH